MQSYVFLVALFIFSNLFSQNSISGYVNVADINNVEEVLLLRVDPLNDTTNEIARASIDHQGYFSFSKSLFEEEDNVYRLALENQKWSKGQSLDDTLYTLKTFILSAEDRMIFNQRVATYESTSIADKEWNKFKKYEDSLHFKNFSEAELTHYLKETKGYIKDSLQILLVKLMSIKTLDQKNLLDKDIRENPDYYESLVEELKSSDLKPAYYTYLESKLNEYRYQKKDTFFTSSLVLNIILIGFIIIGGIKWWRSHSAVEEPNEGVLSKQEAAVKDLILQGKSNKEIAAELFISVSTVKTHITSIYSKLRISNRKMLLSKYQNTTGTSPYLVPEY